LGRPSKVDQAKFEEVVKTNPNTNLQELGAEFKISAWHASRILKKLGFSYKKKALPTWKQNKTNEKHI
jgi:transposase